MPFAVALSEHPVPAVAVGEAVGRILDLVGPAPDLLLVLTGWAMQGAMEDVVPALETLLEPRLLVPRTSHALIGGGQVATDGRGIVLFAAHGLDVETGVVVSHGCRVVGPPFVVTSRLGDVIIELDGEPARARIERALDELTPEDLVLVRRPFLLGDGDDVRRVRGIDERTGAIALDSPSGDLLQVVLRDDRHAEVELSRRLAGPFDAALVTADEDRLPLATVLADHCDAVAGVAVPGWAPLSVVTIAGRN